MLRPPFARVFARDVKVDDADRSARFERLVSAVDGGEPVRNHRQRVRKTNRVDASAFRAPRRRVRLPRLDVRPAVALDSFVGDFQHRFGQVDEIKFLQLRQIIAEKLQIRAGAAPHIDPNFAGAGLHRLHQLFTPGQKTFAELVVTARLPAVKGLEPLGVRVAARSFAR